VENGTLVRRYRPRNDEINRANQNGQPIQDLYETTPKDLEDYFSSVLKLLKENGFIDNESRFLDGCCGNRVLGNFLRLKGFSDIIEFDKFIGEEKGDFLIDNVEEDFDVIFINPPFRYKVDFIKRVIHYGKPAIMILPVATIEVRELRELFSNISCHVFIPPRGMKFLHNGALKNYGDCGYFLFNFFMREKGIIVNTDDAFYTDEGLETYLSADDSTV
jgi:hypothetical protein